MTSNASQQARVATISLVCGILLAILTVAQGTFVTFASDPPRAAYVTGLVLQGTMAIVLTSSGVVQRRRLSQKTKDAEVSAPD